MNFKRALVTGGAGFIGSNLTDELLKRGCEVFVVDNMRNGHKSNIERHFGNSKFIFDKKDIRSQDMYDVFRIFKPDIVFHMAAIPGVSFSVDSPTESSSTNIEGTVHLLDLARQNNVRRFVFSSSSAIYGGSPVLPTPETTPSSPKSPYALQKKVGEDYCKIFSKLYGLDTVSLRYFNCFGENQYGNSPYAAVVSSFAKCLKEGCEPIIYGDGEQYRDFTHVSNIVFANILAANHKEKLNGDIFNIGSGIKITVNELCKLMNLPSPIYKGERSGDVRCSVADITKAAEIFGYKIITPFNDGLEKTISWYINHT